MRLVYLRPLDAEPARSGSPASALSRSESRRPSRSPLFSIMRRTAGAGRRLAWPRSARPRRPRRPRAGARPSCSAMASRSSVRRTAFSAPGRARPPSSGSPTAACRGRRPAGAAARACARSVWPTWRSTRASGTWNSWRASSASTTASSRARAVLPLAPGLELLARPRRGARPASRTPRRVLANSSSSARQDLLLDLLHLHRGLPGLAAQRLRSGGRRRSARAPARVLAGARPITASSISGMTAPLARPTKLVAGLGARRPCPRASACSPRSPGRRGRRGAPRRGTRRAARGCCPERLLDARRR